LLDPRRLTVAVSCAKQKMILVASRSIFSLFSPDEETFANSLLWKNLLLRTCTALLWEGQPTWRAALQWLQRRQRSLSMPKHARLPGLSLFVMIVLFFSLPLVPLAGQEKKPAKALKHVEVDVGGGVKLKLVYIEPGKFMMGSPKEEKERWDKELQHEVEITKGFYMGVFEVTQQEYEKVIGENPSHFKGDRLPVEKVSWEDAMEFCKRLSKKEGKLVDLPTEAEWEYACRAGSKTVFHYGNSLSSKQANFAGDFPYGGAAKGPYLQKTARVGSYEPNAFGLYDMHGNVWEWCKDWSSDEYYKDGPRRAPPGPAKGKRRVVRGGAWDITASGCRSAYRDEDGPGFNEYCVGFRVVVRLP
jgi:formylglycine-generating enzyme required for sulfatase activity